MKIEQFKSINALNGRLELDKYKISDAVLNGMDIDETDSNDLTILSYACEMLDLFTVRWLVRMKADPNKVCKKVLSRVSYIAGDREYDIYDRVSAKHIVKELHDCGLELTLEDIHEMTMYENDRFNKM